MHLTDKLCWLLVQAEEVVSMKLSVVQLSEDKSESLQ